MSLATTSASRPRRAVTRAARPALLTVPLLGICAAILLAGGPAAASQGRAPAVGSTTAGIAWHGCDKGLQCARVRVPLDWDHPRGRTIRLAVIRHLASRPEHRIGSMFVNPGGPGGSFNQVKDDWKNLDAAGEGRFDIVGWDVRGAGKSTRVRCFRTQRSWRRFFDGWALPIPGTTEAQRRFLGKAADLTRRCGEHSGRLLAHMSTADTVRDLDYLRSLVGDRRLTYYGISGGTFIGETYANMFPGRVRAMELDGIVDPIAFTKGTEAGYANQLTYADQGFKNFLSLCQQAGPARCALAGHGSVKRRVGRLLTRLRRRPMSTPRGRLTYGDALAAITANLDRPADWPKPLAAALEKAARGDGADLATLGREGTNEFRSRGFEGSQAIICDDSPSREGPGAWPRVIDRLNRVSRISGRVYGWSVWSPCASWPARGADRYTGPWNASTKNPILVIGTRYDPSTPFRNARRVSHLLGNAVLLTHQGYGHLSSADPSACVNRAIGRYLVHLVTPRRGTVCPSNRQPFDPNFGQPLP